RSPVASPCPLHDALPICWITPTGSAPTIYRKLVRAAYPAIKRVDGRVSVLIGEFTSANNPLAFLQKMGSGIRADGLAYHPFEFLDRKSTRLNSSHQIISY